MLFFGILLPMATLCIGQKVFQPAKSTPSSSPKKQTKISFRKKALQSNYYFIKIQVGVIGIKLVSITMNSLPQVRRQISYGSFKINWILFFYIPIMILTPCYTYYMCVIKNKECQAYHSTITKTAKHYPQNSVFRFTMGIAATILVLVFITLFRWINQQADKSGFPRMSKTLFYTVMFAMVTYCIAVETIDGQGTGPLHSPSAVFFFLTFQVAIVNITLFLYRLREWDTTFMSRRSINIKVALAVYITLTWIYCLYGSLKGGEDNGPDYPVIVEWNAFAINLLWILSFSEEWGKIKLCLVQYQKI